MLGCSLFVRSREVAGDVSLVNQVREEVRLRNLGSATSAVRSFTAYAGNKIEVNVCAYSLLQLQ